MNEKTERYRTKVLVYMYTAGKLTLNQLTQGPIRHLSKRARTQLLRGLVKDGMLIEAKVKRSMGCPALEYRISDSGRVHCEQTLKDEIGGFYGKEVIVRKRQLHRPQPGNLGV